MKRKVKKTKMFNVRFSLNNVEAESAAAVAEMVCAFAAMLGVILKTASAELVAYLHADGYFYSYRQPRGRGKVYKVKSFGPDLLRPGTDAIRELDYFIYIPPGREMVFLNLTHDHPRLSQIVPHWDDLRKLPRNARMWIRLENESEPHWHRMADVLRAQTLPSRVTNSFDCVRHT